MGAGLINIKLFLLLLDNESYGTYAWIVSFCSLGSMFSFLGINTEIFRRLSTSKFISKNEYIILWLVLALASFSFILFTEKITKIKLIEFTLLYLITFILVKILLIPSKVKSNVLLIDYLNTGIFPVTLLLSLSILTIFEANDLSTLFTFHILISLLSLVIILYWMKKKKYLFVFKVSNQSNLKGFVSNSLYLFVTSISSLSFSVLDVFILGLFISPSDLASYVFITRISSVTAIPLGYLVSKYQARIVKENSIIFPGMVKVKVQCIIFIVVSMYMFYLSEELILFYFVGVTKYLDLFYLFSLMYIVRGMFFERLLFVQFVAAMKKYSIFSFFNMVLTIFLLYIFAFKIDVFSFSLVVIVGQLTPILFSIIYSNKPRVI